MREEKNAAPVAPAQEAGEQPLPLLVRDIAADLSTTPIQVCKALADLGFGGHSVNMVVTPQMAKSLRAHFAATAQAAPAAVDGPIWEALHHAWMKIGADVAGLDWGAFTNAVHYAPTAQAALLEALKEAQAGLEFAAARLPHTTGFVPSHIAALNIVNAALAAAPTTKAAPVGQGGAPTDTGPISRQWLTVVYRGVEAGDEVQQICTHPKVSAMSWSHALHDRDVARAQAKKGGA